MFNKNLQRRIIAVLICIVMSISYCLPVFAVDGTSVSLVLDKTIVQPSDATQTITLDIVTSQEVAVDSLMYTVEVPDGWTVSQPAMPDGITGITWSNNQLLWYSTTTDVAGLNNLGSVTITIPENVLADTYEIKVTGFDASAAGAYWAEQETYTATITVTSGGVEEDDVPAESEPAGPYEVYYTLNGSDSDSDKLNEYALGETVTATIWLKNNTNDSVILQAYDVYLNHSAALKFSAVDGKVVAYNGSAAAVVGGSVDHIQFVHDKDNQQILAAGATVELGKVSFTIDSDVAVFGEMMDITLIQAEDTTNTDLKKNVTNFSVGSENTGDKQSYYPVVIGDVEGGEITTQWTITWVNEGNTLGTTVVGHGFIPNYEGETPTKTMDAQYTYVHNGWTPELVPATEDATYTATFEAQINSYTVIWKNWNGTEIYSETLEYGATPSYQGDVPTKTEDDKYTYTFTGWSPEISEVTGAVEYTAEFTPVAKQFTITFELGGGVMPEGYGETLTYTCDDTTNLPKPTLEGYEFNGWKVKATVGNWNAGIYYPVDTVNGKYGNVTLVADWIDVEFVVNCETAENGSVIASPVGGAEGDTIILTVKPDAGFELDTLVYTYLNEGTETEVEIVANENGVYSFQMPGTDVTVIATFKKASLNVSVDTENVANGTVTPNANSAVLGDIVTLTNEPATGYILVEYTVSYYDADGLLRTVEVSEGGTFEMPAYPVTITATFRLIKYSIKFHANNGIGVMADLLNVEYNAELALSQNIFTRDGYTFLGWSLDPNATEKTYVDQETIKNLSATEGEEVVLYAVWKADTFTITLNTNSGTINSGNVTSYVYGTVTQLPTDVTKTGFTFGGWYTDEALTQGPVAAITATEFGNKVFYAKWNRTASVAVENYTFAANGYVLIRVTDNILPSQEYRFNGMAMYWTNNEDYLLDKTKDTGVFYLLVEDKYVENGVLTAEGNDLLTIEDMAEGVSRAKIDYTGDINGDGVLNIADANIVYQMVQNGGGYYTGDHDLTMEQRLMADMHTATVSGDKRGTLDDVHAIVSMING